MSELILYGSPASPPSRAVYWACLLNELEFEYVQTEIDQMGASAIIRSLNPACQVPTLVDGDFALAEMPAILAYLSDKHGWGDLYPSDIQTRAKINQYLHFHHNFTRNLSMRLMGTHVISTRILDAMGNVGDEVFKQHVRDPNKLATGQAVVSQIASLIEESYFPDTCRYLCTEESPTIADLACFEEVMAVNEAKLFEFSAFPKMAAWIEAMHDLPFYEPVHRYNIQLGDIREDSNTIERLASAVEAGVNALEQCNVRVSALARD